MPLSVEWAKRWLPAVLLILSMLLPWSTMIIRHLPISGEVANYNAYMSFLSGDAGFPSLQRRDKLTIHWELHFSKIPYMGFVLVLIVASILSALSGKRETRILGGLLGIIGVVSYLILVFPKSFVCDVIKSRTGSVSYFGIHTTIFRPIYESTAIWFLSIGFYLALAGSLMLLLPLIRAILEKLRMRARKRSII